MTVENVNRLMKKFNQLGAIDPTMYQAVKKQAEVVRGAAVQLCPAQTGELRGSIYTKVDQDAGAVIGTVYTNKEYASYVEFGTGPVGEANHVGISPNVDVSYRQDGWVYQDPDGNFHATKGQAAQPFLYPALKSMEKRVVKGIKADFKAAIREVGEGK